MGYRSQRFRFVIWFILKEKKHKSVVALYVIVTQWCGIVGCAAKRILLNLNENRLAWYAWSENKSE